MNQILRVGGRVLLLMGAALTLGMGGLLGVFAKTGSHALPAAYPPAATQGTIRCSGHGRAIALVTIGFTQRAYRDLKRQLRRTGQPETGQTLIDRIRIAIAGLL
jgi:hypothetical protein